MVETLTSGYERRFVAGEWRRQGLRLVGMLVQEDTCKCSGRLVYPVHVGAVISFAFTH